MSFGIVGCRRSRSKMKLLLDRERPRLSRLRFLKWRGQARQDQFVCRFANKPVTYRAVPDRRYAASSLTRTGSDRARGRHIDARRRAQVSASPTVPRLSASRQFLATVESTIEIPAPALTAQQAKRWVETLMRTIRRFPYLIASSSSRTGRPQPSECLTYSKSRVSRNRQLGRCVRACRGGVTMTLSSAAKGWARIAPTLVVGSTATPRSTFLSNNNLTTSESEASITSTSISGCFRRYVDRRAVNISLPVPSEAIRIVRFGGLLVSERFISSRPPLVRTPLHTIARSARAKCTPGPCLTGSDVPIGNPKSPVVQSTGGVDQLSRGRFRRDDRPLSIQEHCVCLIAGVNPMFANALMTHQHNKRSSPNVKKLLYLSLHRSDQR
jgi:hypothetical protein